MNVRLETLKKALHLEWGELAKCLGVSRSLIDQVRKNRRNLGPKTFRRLIELERSAGITNEQDSHKISTFPEAVHPVINHPKNVKIQDKCGDEMEVILDELIPLLDRFRSVLKSQSRKM
jgi:transcriptional regulator with XRE-family HTH domain